jgi:hypothetical protein
MTDELDVWCWCDRCGTSHEGRIVGRSMTATPDDPGVPVVEPGPCPDPPPAVTPEQMLERLGELAGGVLATAADARDWELAERAAEAALVINDPRPER